jgi:hypothetical protein
VSEREETRAIPLERPNGHNGAWSWRSQTGDAWSFGSRARLFALLKPRAPADPDGVRSAAANTGQSPTVSPRRAVDVSDLKPVAPVQPFLGKRGFMPVYQWEGVVEEVNGSGFRARLQPFEDGRADHWRVEYADFAYDDLADESDRDLVQEGAVFYWTVGRSRNAAGTYTNTSLVRFRRLPPSTPYETREASREAEALLSDLGGNASS